MHSIIPSIAARELDVSKQQVFLWVERGLINSKTTEHGTRILVNKSWRRFKQTWKAEDVPTETDKVVDYIIYTKGASVSRRKEDARERREKAYALADEGIEREEIAERLGISPITVHQYMRRRSHYA